MYYFVGSFYLATVLTTVKMSTTSSTLAKFERNHQLDNLLCSDAEKVFSNDAESKSECAISCKENQSCYTIFFSQSSGKCYGCNTVYNSVSVQNLPPGDGNVHYQIYPRSFYLATVLTTVKMSTTSSTLAKFERNHQLDNLLCSDAEKVFSNDAESKSECAISCKENQSCYTIFFSQSSGKCYGCNTVYNSVSVQNLPPGDGNVHYQIYPLCSEGWFGYMRSCYKLSTHVWFTQGSVECASEGGHAVYIETSVENEFLKDFIRTDSTTWAWYIGITDCAEPGVWRYHGSDEPVQFTDFKVLNTGDSCCALFFDGYDYQWAQYGCEDPDHGFPTICEKTVL